MKRTAQLQFIIVIAMLMLLAGTAAFGATDPLRNVAYTPHNMSASSTAAGTYKSTNNQEICVFCHTPHNANINRALWNKSNPDPTGLTYHMYTSGVDLSPATKQVTTPRQESLMCLTCHDGRTALNVVHNAKYAAGTNQIVVNGKTMYQLDINGSHTDWTTGYPDPQGFRMGAFAPDPIMQIDAPANLGAYRAYEPDGSFAPSTDPLAGTEFGDDHPISMSYDTVFAQKKTKYPTNPGLIEPTPANLADRLSLIKFYGSDRRVECGSCHDPHVAYGLGGVGDSQFAPFLRKTNVASELCLSCHDK